MKCPKISVIVPCYNQEIYLEECLKSILEQTFQDFEIICINDGSTDNSQIILEKYAKQDSRIKIIKQNNQGVVLSRNNAIKIAKGKYIYPLDADDKIAPTCLKKLYTIMKEGIYDVVYSQTEFFGAKNGLFCLPKPSKKNMSKRNCVVCSALYKKSDWKKFGGYDTEMNEGYEDWEFWLNFIENNKKFYRIDEVLFFYRQKNKSRNTSIPTNTIKKLLKYIYNKHKKLNICLKNEKFTLHMKLFGIIPIGKFTQIGNQRHGILKYLPFISIKATLK